MSETKLLPRVMEISFKIVVDPWNNDDSVNFQTQTRRKKISKHAN